MAHLFKTFTPPFFKPEKSPPPSFDDRNLQSTMERNRDKSMFLLTDMNGKKICMGTYHKTDLEWNTRLDQHHYTDAGILWFLFEGNAYRMPGY